MKLQCYAYAVTLLGASLSSVARKPNIVLYLADDLGIGEVNQQSPEWRVYKHQAIDLKPDLIIGTPGLEKLAKASVRLTRSYTSSPICGPARYSLFTGVNVGISSYRGMNVIGKKTDYPLPPNAMTIPSVLRSKAGYSTYGVGKWGLGDGESTGVPWKQGFDRFLGFLTHADAHKVFPASLASDAGEIFYPENLDASASKCLCIYGVTCLLDPDTGKMQMSARCTNANQVFRRQAMQYIDDHLDQQPSSKPFFLFWGSISPHTGYFNPFDTSARSETVPVSTYGRYAGLLQRKVNPHRVGHAASITHELDQDITVLLQKVSDRGIRNDTVIVFMSDNGPYDGLLSDRGYTTTFFNAAAGLKGAKRQVYEGGSRSPTMISWPGTILEGSVSDVPNVGSDIFMTLLGFAGIDPTDLERSRILQQDKLLPLFRQGDSVDFSSALPMTGGRKLVASANQLPRSWLHVEICWSPFSSTPDRGCDFAFYDFRNPLRELKIVRDNYKYELFDITADPFEKKELSILEANTLQDVLGYMEAGGFRTPYCDRVPSDCRAPTMVPTTSAPTTARPTRPTPVPTTARPTSQPTKEPTDARLPTFSPTDATDIITRVGKRMIKCGGSYDFLSLYAADSAKSCFIGCLKSRSCTHFSFSDHARCILYRSCRLLKRDITSTSYAADAVVELYHAQGQTCSASSEALQEKSFAPSKADCARLCLDSTCTTASWNTLTKQCTVYAFEGCVIQSSSTNDHLFNGLLLTRDPALGPPLPPPTRAPTSKAPTGRPTKSPTAFPTAFPSAQPTLRPTKSPTLFPTARPTRFPTLFPTVRPTKPTRSPTARPTRTLRRTTVP